LNTGARQHGSAGAYLPQALFCGNGSIT